MAQYDIKLEANELVDLLSNNDQFTKLTETIINQVLDAQVMSVNCCKFRMGF